MSRITFRKIRLGSWQRSDGELSKIVNEESMHREIQKLILDGWEITPQGMIHEGTYHARSYELTKIPSGPLV